MKIVPTETPIPGIEIQEHCTSSNSSPGLILNTSNTLDALADSHVPKHEKETEDNWDNALREFEQNDYYGGVTYLKQYCKPQGQTQRDTKQMKRLLEKAARIERKNIEKRIEETRLLAQEVEPDLQLKDHFGHNEMITSYREQIHALDKTTKLLLLVVL